MPDVNPNQVHDLAGAEADGDVERADAEPRTFGADLFGEGVDAEGPTVRGSGASAEDIEEECDPHQEDLLDKGIEETFPASDPVSVKRIT